MGLRSCRSTLISDSDIYRAQRVCAFVAGLMYSPSDFERPQIARDLSSCAWSGKRQGLLKT